MSNKLIQQKKNLGTEFGLCQIQLFRLIVTLKAKGNLIQVIIIIVGIVSVHSVPGFWTWLRSVPRQSCQ